MLKQITYTYVGVNGILTTPIHLEGIPSVKKIILTAEEGKMLTKDNKNYVKKVALTSEDDITLWKEVIGQK